MSSEQKTDPIIYEKADGVAKITFNRGKNELWVIDLEVAAALRAALQDAQQDDNVRVVVITGRGRSFCVGADINMFIKFDNVRKARKFFRDVGYETHHLIEKLDKPVIAAVNGFCLGGGLEVAMACDIIIASENAKLGLPEMNLGVFPGWGGSQRLPRLVGRIKAKEMIFTGDMIDAKEAERIGLVNKAVPPEKFEETVNQMVEKLKSKAPITLALAKAAINRGMDADLNTGLAYESEADTVAFATEDCMEGVKAFLEKRKPQFKGK
jgi:enoyl-CoA hydratase/carnithine racemase